SGRAPVAETVNERGRLRAVLGRPRGIVEVDLENSEVAAGCESADSRTDSDLDRLAFLGGPGIESPPAVDPRPDGHVAAEEVAVRPRLRHPLQLSVEGLPLPFP